jgi:hypothetical protein
VFSFSRCCYLIIALSFSLSGKAGPGLSRSHLDSAVELSCSDRNSLATARIAFWLLRIDARKLSELLYLNKLSSVYHGEPGIRTLKELARSYIVITRDLTRVISCVT